MKEALPNDTFIYYFGLFSPMKSGLYLLLLFCFFPFVLAEEPSFTVLVEPTERSILFNQSAEFDLIIQNNLAQIQQFTIYSPDVAWDIQFIPVSDRFITIPGGLSKSVRVKLRPLYVSPGVFGVSLNIKAGEEIQKALLFVSVSQHQQAEAYLPALYSEFRIPSEIDPREENNFTLLIENRNRKTLGNIELSIQSNVFQREEQVSLGPLEKKEFTFSLDLDPATPPQEDTLQATFVYKEDGKTYHFDARPKTYTIQGYGGIEEEKESTSSFFKYKDTVTFTNTGNARKNHVYTVPTSFLKNLFTTTEPLGGVYEKKGEKSVITFTLLLDAGEKETVIITRNYRPLIWILLALLILVFLYHAYKSPVVLSKTSRVVATQEGGASELKVVITVKNRGPKTMQDILVMDKIPNLAHIVREFEPGTLAPSQILKNESKGTLLKWNIDRLEKFEERLISYHIKTQLAVLGNIQLPPAVAKYRTLQGKEKIVTSTVKGE